MTWDQHLTVLFAQKYPCVRAQKIARAIKRAKPGWTIWSASEGPIHERNNPFFDTRHYQKESDLRAIIDELEPDIIHTHNEPDDVALWAAGAGRPLIHDVHDMTSKRFGGVPDAERAAYEAVDHLVFATPQFEEWAREDYDVEQTTLFESRVEEGLFVNPRTPETGVSVVYQGGTNGFPYRKYARDLHALAAQGFKVGIYPARKMDMWEYEGLMVLKTQPHADLLLALSRYHYAYVGFAFHETEPETQRYCHACLPNKFFDAMAAGVPVIVRNCRTVERIVQEHGLGLVWNGGDIRHVAEQAHARLRANVLEMRGMFTMERQVGKLLKVYKELTDEHTGEGHGDNPEDARGVVA